MKSFFILLLLFPLLSFAQKEDRVWVFDDSIAIDWNDTLNPIVNQIGTNTPYLDENYCSISDKNGSLLYYISEGSQYWGNSGLLSGIYGSDETIIPNGDSIFSNRSITQGILFIPFINDSNKYYLFYLSIGTWPQYSAPGFNYGVIDKSIGIYGTCISKNNSISVGQFSEKLTAIRHGNGTDWWIIIHKDNTNEFYKYLLSSSGISGPSIQSIGPLLSVQGQMKFSPDGSKLGLVDRNINEIAIFDFNRCTGVFSNYNNLGTETGYGCSFSPNNKIFYASTINKLFQFNLDSPNISQSKLLIWDDSTNQYVIGQHLLAPNGKIYIGSGFHILPNQVFNVKNMNLTVIQNPNIYGSGCSIQPYSFYLNGLRFMFGFPNMVNYNLGSLIGSPCDTILNCISTQNNFNESICSGDVFDFNGTALTITGTYHDTLMNFSGCDSLVTLQLSVLNTTSGSTSASICNGDSYSFNGNQLTATGNYFDTLVNAQGCDSLITLQLSVLNTTSSNTSASICSGDSYSFNGNQLTAAGNYFDTLVNAQGCDSLITLQLSVLNNSVFSSSQKICAGDTLHIGSFAHSIAGIFIDTLLNAIGCDSIVTTLLIVDSVIVSVSSIADTLTATASGVGISYQWINCDSSTNIIGATNQKFVATTTGNYAVIGTDANNCSKQSDCVYVLVSGYGFVVSDYEFTLYPNPTDGLLTIVLRQAQHDNEEIEIVDVLGRRIERLLRTDYSSRNDIFTIDVSALTAGVYFLKMIMSDGSFEVKKFVKE